MRQTLEICGGITHRREMNITKLGEFSLIDLFAKQFSEIPAGHIGIGDDCAVIPINELESWVITTDMLVEDQHFVRDQISPLDLGWKTVAVNLSDVAAMGANPQFTFLSVALPSQTPVEWVKEFARGYTDCSKSFQTLLMGGDTVGTKEKIVINVVAIGRITNQYLKLRKAAKPGDLIVTTGYLGDSAAGFRLQSSPLDLNTNELYLKRRHHCPTPRVSEGQWRAQQSAVHAMMDLSDGLVSDLPKICSASGITATVELEKVEVSPELLSVASRTQWNLDDLKISGGEDYELLLTIEEENYEQISQLYAERFGRPLIAIGKMRDGTDEVLFTKNGCKFTPAPAFQHFG